MPFTLGSIQLVDVESDVVVANLIGQHGTGWKNGVAPVRYWAIALGLVEVAKVAKEDDASVHMPKMGAGLAGGDWAEIETIIQATLCAEGIPVTVYNFHL